MTSLSLEPLMIDLELPTKEPVSVVAAIQHSYDGGQTFQPAVTHCTIFDPKYEKIPG